MSATIPKTLYIIGLFSHNSTSSPCTIPTIAVYIVATLLFIPGSILTLGAGFVFSMALNGLGVGVLVGTLCVVIGASIGAILAFLLGRYLLLEQVHKLSKKYAIFEALNVSLETNGLKIFILLRYVQ